MFHPLFQGANMEQKIPEWIHSWTYRPAYYDNKQLERHCYYYNGKPLSTYVANLIATGGIDSDNYRKKNGIIIPHDWLDRLIDVAKAGDFFARIKAFTAIEVSAPDDPRFIEIIKTWALSETMDDTISASYSVIHDEEEFYAIRDVARFVWERIDPNVTKEQLEKREMALRPSSFSKTVSLKMPNRKDINSGSSDDIRGDGVLAEWFPRVSSNDYMIPLNGTAIKGDDKPHKSFREKARETNAQSPSSLAPPIKPPSPPKRQTKSAIPTVPDVISQSKTTDKKIPPLPPCKEREKRTPPILPTRKR